MNERQPDYDVPDRLVWSVIVQGVIVRLLAPREQDGLSECVSECVCVCVREREREREKETGRHTHTERERERQID